MSDIRKFPTRLKRWKYEIERFGRKHGLDFPETIFYVVSSEEMSEFIAHGGYPVSYHHWTKGQDSLRMKQRITRFGLGKIYEVIVPTTPAYSLLLDTNEEHEQKAVIAHAQLGHGDFFLNNVWFESLPQNIHQMLEFHAKTMDDFRIKYGKERVDMFLEACLSVDNLIDVLGALIKREPETPSADEEMSRTPGRVERPDDLPEYMEDIINPKELLDEYQRELDEEKRRNVDIRRGAVVPSAPVRDVLGFLMQYSSLEPWQREVMRIVRDESVWAWTGGQTKIMNEGWASFWDAEIATVEGIPTESEMFGWTKMYARGVSLTRDPLDPYAFGYALWQDIRFRWNTGRFGPIWTDCRSREIREHWDSFVVFKMLYDRYGAVDEHLLRSWSEFITLIEQTNAGNGRHPEAYFAKRDWAMEWLALEAADERLMGLSKIQKRVDWLELEIESRMKEEGLEPDDLRRFEIHREISKRNRWPHEFNWTMDEVLFEIEDTRKLLNLYSQIRSGEVPLSTRAIPEIWIAWADRHSKPIELGRGMEKIFQVRETHNDAMFVQDFFTKEFCEEHGYVTYARAQGEGYSHGDVYKVRSSDAERVKAQIVKMIRNVRQPVVELVDANFDDGQQLLLRHVHDGRDLINPEHPEYEHKLREVLMRLWTIWGRGRPVHLETVETTYPPRRNWYWYWRPQGVDSSGEGNPPEYQKVRWTCSGGKAVFKTEISEFGEKSKKKKNGPRGKLP